MVRSEEEKKRVLSFMLIRSGGGRAVALPD